QGRSSRRADPLPRKWSWLPRTLSCLLRRGARFHRSSHDQNRGVCTAGGPGGALTPAGPVDQASGAGVLTRRCRPRSALRTSATITAAQQITPTPNAPVIPASVENESPDGCAASTAADSAAPIAPPTVRRTWLKLTALPSWSTATLR